MSKKVSQDAFEKLKDKSIKEIIQFFKDSGFTIPEDNWFRVGVTLGGNPLSKSLVVLGRRSQMEFYHTGVFSTTIMLNNEKVYSEHIKKQIKKRIKQL